MTVHVIRSSGDADRLSSWVQPFVMIVGLAGAVRTWLLVRPGWFVSDDFLNFQIARDMGATRAYFERSLFGHLEPGHRLANWLMVSFGAGWRTAAIVTALGIGVTTLLLDRTLAAYGARPGARMMAAVLYAFSLAMTASQIWWSAAVNALPATSASLATLLTLRRARDRDSSFLAVLAAAVCTAGTTFYEFVPLVIALVISLEYSPWSTRPSWRVTVGFATTYLLGQLLYWGRFLAGDYRNESGEPPGVGVLISFVRSAVVRGYGGSTLGINFSRLRTPERLLDVLVVLVAVGLLIVARTFQRWIAPTVGALAVLLGHVVIVGIARAARDGQSASLEMRYYADIAWLFPLWVGVVSRSPRPRVWTRARPFVLGVACAVAGVGAVSTVGAARIAANGPSRAAGRYIANLRSSLPDGAVELADGRLPVSLMPPQFAPYDDFRQSIASYLPKRVGFDAGLDPKWMLTVSGIVVPVRSLIVASADPGCLSTHGDPAEFRLPGASREHPDRYVFVQGRIEAGAMVVRQAREEGVVDLQWFSALGPDVSANMRAHADAVGGFSLVITPHSTVCISRFDLAVLEKVEQ